MLPILLGTLLQVVPADRPDCQELGFEQGIQSNDSKNFPCEKFSLELECGSCKELNEFGLKELESECLDCCRKSEEESSKFKVQIVIDFINIVKIGT